MFKRLSALLIAAAIIAGAAALGISGPGTALAAGLGPDDALSPNGQWTALETAQPTWYAFNYAGDGSQIVVRMGVDASHPAAFEVWTPDQLAQWARGESVSPIGRGAANDLFGGDLVWTGSFNTAGVYYVLVTAETPTTYALQISGDGVSFRTPAAATSTEPATTTAPATTAASQPPAAAAKTGQGPATALTAAGEWSPLAVGQSVWYAFTYPGDGSPVTVRMSVGQSDSAAFAVWTPDDLARAAQDDSVQPVGRGSVNDQLGGDLVWTGNFNTPGVYYVVVTQTGSTPANYALTIN